MAKRAGGHLTAGQLEIMELFWERGELGVAQVWKLLAARRERVVARNTVQTMVARLADRGWLTARGEGNAFYYRAARPRESAVTGMLGTLLDTAFGGSASGLVMALIESRRVSKDEARRIREIIDRAEREDRHAGRDR